MLFRWLAPWAVVCLLAGSAAAQEKPDYDAARRHYLSGKDAQSMGDYEGAIRSFILAYDITKDPSLFKQIGLAYESEGKKTEALVYYRRYLSEAKPGTDTGDVRAKLAVLDGSTIKPSPPGPATQPSPGEAEPAKLPPEPPPGAVLAIEPLPPVPAAPAMMDEAGAGWQRTAAWISVGIAAAALTTGAVLATSASSREEDIRRLVEFREPVTHQPSRYAGSVKDDYDTKVDEGQKLNRYSVYAFIGAGAFASAAVVFFILDATHSVEQPKPVSIAPAIGSQGLGVVAGWEF